MSDERMPEFLPCPFCGSAEISESIGTQAGDEPWPYIGCEKCGAVTEPEIWNKRDNALSDERMPDEPPMFSSHQAWWNYSHALRTYALALEQSHAETTRQLDEVWAHVKATVKRNKDLEQSLKQSNARIQAFIDMRDSDELLRLGHAMLGAPKESFRWHAEKLAQKIGCCGPYMEGDAARSPEKEGM